MIHDESPYALKLDGSDADLDAIAAWLKMVSGIGNLKPHELRTTAYGLDDAANRLKQFAERYRQDAAAADL